MHAVLYRQPDGLHPQQHQPLKQRLAEPGAGRGLVHNDWAQLAVVAHQYQLRQGSAAKQGEKEAGNEQSAEMLTGKDGVMLLGCCCRRRHRCCLASGGSLQEA